MRNSYSALSSSVATSSRTSDYITNEVCKIVRMEAKNICSTKQESIFRSADEAIGDFNFEKVWSELRQKMPTLIKIILAVLPVKEVNKPLICLIIGMILKQRFSKMSLIQRVLSVFLYGQGASKKVHA